MSQKQPQSGFKFSAATAALFLLVVESSLFGQQPTGAVEGRVFAAGSESALPNVRIAVENSTLETISSSDGAFRLANVPVGPAKLLFSYIGFEGQVVSTTIPAGGIVRHEVELAGRGSQNITDSSGEPIKLQAFAIVADREMSAQALAMNEQRQAPNLKNVVALDEYGDRSTENLGEFMRFLPGVALVENGATPSEISLRGFPGNTTGVLIDGGEIAGARSGSTRSVALLEIPMSNISRVEITKVPTPDMSASGLGGSVNLISKSGFERKKPLLTYLASTTFNNRNGGITLGGGPRTQVGATTVKHIEPTFSFSYLHPLNKSLAFTFGGARSWRQQKPLSRADEVADWNLVNLFQRQSQWFSIPSIITTNSLQAGVDWKLSARDVVSFSSQYRTTWTYLTRSDFLVNYGAGATGSRDFTQGATTAVGVASQNTGTNFELASDTNHVALKYSHNGDRWRLNASATLSAAASATKDIERGHFNSAPARISNLVIRGDGIGLGGSSIATTYSARDRLGAAVDLFDGGNYAIESASSNQTDFQTRKVAVRIDAGRDFLHATPISIKVGAAVDRLDKDNRTYPKTWNFAPGGSTAVANRQARNFDVFDEAFNSTAPSVYGRRMNWISLTRLYDLYRQKPEYFILDKVAAHQNQVANSKRLIETVAAGYLRGDLRLLRNRLWIVTGARLEHTTAEGWGRLDNPSAQYLLDASGRPVLNTAGQPTLITTDPLARAQLRYIERGNHGKRSYQGIYPSINTSYSISENLLLRAAYARTIGRPNVDFIVPGILLPDPTNASARTITAVNTGLEPWTADNFDLSMESYQFKDGFGSVGVFRKKIRNFFTSVITPATPELLAVYGLPNDSVYLGYDISTRQNGGDATVNGYEINYRQALSFLPRWASGVQVFGNLTHMALDGSSTADFNSFNPDTLAWGVNLVRAKYYVKFTCTYQGETRRGSVGASTASGIPAGTYAWQGARTRYGINAQYSFSRQVALFCSLMDLGGGFKPLTKRYAPETPSYARIQRYQDFGSSFVLGLKGEY